MYRASFTHGYALLIGVGAHKNDARLSLPVTVKDVDALHRTLVEPELCGYPDDDEHVRVAINDQATNSNILAGLSWLKSKAKEDQEATIVIYFSGHGWVSPAAEYFLITQDTVPGAVSDSALRAMAFTNVLRDVDAERLLIVLDCCHAQGMAEVKDLDALDPELSKGLNQSEGAVKSITDVLAKGKGRAVFSSSQGNEKSYYFTNNSMSVFTYHFIEALQGAGHRPGNTEVTIASLMDHVSKTVPETTARLYKANQHPFYKIEAMNFPVALIRGGKGLPAGGWSSVKSEAERYLGQFTQGALLTGSGAIAQGTGAVAVGQGGVYISGSSMGTINTGTQISGDYVTGDKVLGDKIGTQINTGGGAYIGGSVHAERDFVGRDRFDVKTSHGTAPGDPTGRISAKGKQLASLLNDFFSASELEGLCFELDIDWDNFRSETKEAKAYSMVSYCEQRDRLNELKRLVRVARPNLRSQLT